MQESRFARFYFVVSFCPLETLKHSFPMATREAVLKGGYFYFLGTWLLVTFCMHTGHTSVRRLLALHAYLMFQSKGLPDVSGNRFFLQLQKERKKQ
jgi:hypothetical protein